MDPASFLLSGGSGGLDFGSSSSSTTGPIYTSGVTIGGKGIEPIYIWVGLGLVAFWLFKGGK